MHVSLNKVHMTSYDCTYPNMRAHIQGKPNRKWAAMASVRHSIRHGENASRNTAQDSRRNALGSRPRPALVRIIVNAIFLKQTNIIISIHLYNIILLVLKIDVMKFDNSRFDR